MKYITPASFLSCLLFTALLLCSCANRIAPSGGEKDTNPPKLVSSSPENFSTDFSQKEIIIRFDEFVELSDINKQLIISPLIDPSPEITANKNTLKIKFEKPLAENTTYTFNFGSSIVDVHEKNTGENFQFVFSTGSFIDSLSVSGTIENAFNLKTEKGILVMLYKSFEDSTPSKTPPDYYAKTNDAGNFQINNIAAGSYTLFALKDKNSNFLFDQPDEEIAFMNALINLSDSLKPTLRLFKNPASKIRIVSSSVEEQGKLKIIFNDITQNLSFYATGAVKNPWQLEEFSVNKDTVIIWMTDTTIDSLKTVFSQNEQPFDTALFSLRKKISGRGTKTEKLLITSNVSAGSFNPGTDLRLLFAHPVKLMDESKIQFKIDSAAAGEIIYNFLDSIKRNLSIKYTWKENENYEFIFFPGAFTDIFSLKNDTMKISFKLKPVTEFGNVVLKVKPVKDNINLIVQLVNDKDEIAEEKIISITAELPFNLIAPGSYRFKIIYDENNNNRWDTGNYYLKKQPEKVIYYKEPVIIRSNWDLETEWALTE
ncbi:MAG: Ig-like domain-containing domain [Bacteroidia bacterium]